MTVEPRVIVRRVWELIEPYLEAQGYELVELDFTGQGGNPVLRVFIDKPAGITLDDCAAVSQLLNPVLDEADPIAASYLLEVSSPGIDRPLRKPGDFERFAGEEVRLTTHAPLEGRSRFKGTLTGFSDGLIGLECDGKPVQIHVENLKRANLNR